MKETIKAPAARDGDAEVAVWKRLIPFAVGIGVAFVVGIAVGAAGTFVALRTPKPASEDEKTIVKLLETEYEAVCEMDDKQRVIKVQLEKPFVNDQALDHVVKLKYLKHLSLRDSAVTDAGMEKLRSLKRLEALGITGTAVTDQGLAQLESISSLQHVWVIENDRLTKQGEASLQRALPKINIHVMNGK